MRNNLLLIGLVIQLLSPLAAQSVKVVSPNGNESWVLNSSHAITWTSGNAGNVKVDIILRRSNNTKVGVIKSQVSLAAGSWPWLSVGKLEDGTVVAPGTDYIVRIRDAANTFGDDSNSAFTISGALPPPPPPAGSASIIVTSPNGGETWFNGRPHSITWNAANWTGTVRLELWQNGVDKGDIATGIPSSPGNYPWQVGKLVSGSAGNGSGYKVRVVKEYKGLPAPMPLAQLKDESDNAFSIGFTRPDTQAPAFKAPIKVTRPEEGLVYFYGEYGRPMAAGVEFSVFWETDCPGPFEMILCEKDGKIIRKLNSSNVKLTPVDTPPGMYRIRVQSVDGKCSGISGRFSVKYKVVLGARKPDLMVCKVYPSIVKTKGNSPALAYIRIYVKNIGSASSKECTLRYTFQNANSDERRVIAIPAGATSQIEIDGVFNGVGPWPFTLIIDGAGEVDESNENNNILNGTIPNQQPEDPAKCSDKFQY